MKTQTIYTPLFTSFVTHLIKIEGGYVNNPKDAGKETKYGISKRQYPHLNIASLTKEDAIAIYHRDYWLFYKCDEVAESSPALACFYFDSLVNHRPKTAKRILQSGLRVLADGIVGKNTMSAIRQIGSSNKATRVFIARCFMFRADFYHDLVLDKPSQDEFFMGWMKRLFVLQQFIESEVINSCPH